MRKKAFTLVEIMVVLFAVSVIMVFLYRMMSGTSSQFLKSRTKLSNLRAASIVIERIKEDLRLAMPPSEDNELKVTDTSMTFRAYDKAAQKSEIITYSYDETTSSVMRKLGLSEADRKSVV